MAETRLTRKEQLGYINSPEAREKMSESQRRRFEINPMSEETRSKLSKSLKGKSKPPFTEEHRRRISASGRIPRPWMRGEKSRFWRGGTAKFSKLIKTSFQYRQWREAIFKRDDWTCRDCGKRGGIVLHPHHIKDFSSILQRNNIKIFADALACEELWDINNGMTLCRNCHKQTANYGWNQFNFRRMVNISGEKEIGNKAFQLKEE
jgi:5-methylcytosine-specific restriction endonuclease McrA